MRERSTPSLRSRQRRGSSNGHDIRVECIAEALHEGDGAALAPADAPLPAGTAAKRGEDGAYEEREDSARHLRVIGQAMAQREREREHPLSHGDLGEHAVHEMPRGVGHAAATAGGAEGPALARKSHESVAAAGIAANAYEAMLEQATRKVGAELTLHEAGHGVIALSCPREERLELFTDDGMEDGLLGPASRVGRGAGRCGSACAAGLERRLAGHARRLVRRAYQPHTIARAVPRAWGWLWRTSLHGVVARRSVRGAGALEGQRVEDVLRSLSRGEAWSASGRMRARPLADYFSRASLHSRMNRTEHFRTGP